MKKKWPVVSFCHAKKSEIINRGTPYFKRETRFSFVFGLVLRKSQRSNAANTAIEVSFMNTIYVAHRR